MAERRDVNKEMESYQRNNESDSQEEDPQMLSLFRADYQRLLICLSSSLNSQEDQALRHWVNFPLDENESSIPQI